MKSRGEVSSETELEQPAVRRGATWEVHSSTSYNPYWREAGSSIDPQSSRGITIFMSFLTDLCSCARVAKPGQRRWIQGPFSKGFVSSNLTPRIDGEGMWYLQCYHPSLLKPCEGSHRGIFLIPSLKFLRRPSASPPMEGPGSFHRRRERGPHHTVFPAPPDDGKNPQHPDIHDGEGHEGEDERGYLDDIPGDGKGAEACTGHRR
jgi:hypothetical protein